MQTLQPWAIHLGQGGKLVNVQSLRRCEKNTASIPKDLPLANSKHTASAQMETKKARSRAIHCKGQAKFSGRWSTSSAIASSMKCNGVVGAIKVPRNCPLRMGILYCQPSSISAPVVTSTVEQMTEIAFVYFSS